MFQKATKTQSRLRLALCGPSGSGKTFTALNIAQHLGKTVAVIDTEHGSASKYADRFDFDVCELTDHHPAKYIEAIKAAAQAEYEVVILDSLLYRQQYRLLQNRKTTTTTAIFYGEVESNSLHNVHNKRTNG